jgi:hypothetical protein
VKFNFQVFSEGVWCSGEIDLHGMIDHQIHGHERFNHFWIPAQARHGGTHRRQIDQERNAGEILQNNACYDERDLLCPFGLRIPLRQLADALLRNFLAVAVAQDRFEHQAKGHRQSGDGTNARLFQRW